MRCVGIIRRGSREPWRKQGSFDSGGKAAADQDDTSNTARGCVVPGGLGNFRIVFPAMNRWAFMASR
jgi:hypothetical protein